MYTFYYLLALIMLVSCNKKEKLQQDGKRQEIISSASYELEPKVRLSRKAININKHLAPTTNITHNYRTNTNMLCASKLGGRVREVNVYPLFKTRHSQVNPNIILENNFAYWLDARGNFSSVDLATKKMQIFPLLQKIQEKLGKKISSSFIGGGVSKVGKAFYFTLDKYLGAFSEDIFTRHANTTSLAASTIERGGKMHLTSLEWVVELPTVTYGYPVISKGAILISGIDNYTYCFDKNSHKILWMDNDIGSLESSSQYIPPKINGTNALIFSHSGNLSSVDVVSGRLHWQNMVTGANALEDTSFVNSEPVVVNDVVIAGFYHSKTNGIDAESGEVLWQRATGINSNICFADWAAFFIDDRKRLLSIEASSGDLAQVCDLGRHFKRQRCIGPVLINGELVVFGEKGKCCVIDVNTLQIKRVVELGIRIYDVPFVHANKLYVLGNRLYEVL